MEMRDSIFLIDDSFSMNHSFKEEKESILKIIDDSKMFDDHTKIRFGDSSKTNLWETLGDAVKENEKIVLVSDLWDTTGDQLVGYTNRTIYIFVPYYYTNEEGKQHVIETIKGTILEKCSKVRVYAIFLDSLELCFYNHWSRIPHYHLDHKNP